VEHANAVEYRYNGGGIRLEGVSFSYKGASTPIFQNLSLSVEPGDWVTIVGQSGIGKSTLFNLIVRCNLTELLVSIN
jgi:ABC-type bacteriocin/lantibiotic exporter with double-glycine peptidase domain